MWSTGNATEILPMQQSCWVATKAAKLASSSGYQHQLECLRSCQKLWEQGQRPSAGTVVAALKACGILRDLSSGRKLHWHAIESGDVRNLLIANTLVAMYAKCGSLVDARTTFEAIPHRDVVSWNCMIGGYAKWGQGQEALNLYDRMQQQEGFRPDAVTFVAALKACSGIAAAGREENVDAELGDLAVLEKGREIHALAQRCGHVDRNIYVASISLDMYAKCGSMEAARGLFERMQHRDVVTWTAMIMGYAQCGEGAAALELYVGMCHEGVVANEVTYVAAFKACASLAEREASKMVCGRIIKEASLDKGRAIHCAATRHGYSDDLYVGSSLVDMYGKCGSLSEACWVFDRMCTYDVVSWTAMIMSYALCGEGKKAICMYGRMEGLRLTPSAATFVAVLKACGIAGELETCRLVHRQVCHAGLDGNATLGSSLVDVYGKCGSMREAEDAFWRMEKPSLVTWSALLEGYARQGHTWRALSIFERMKERLTPDPVAFLSVLNACNHGGLASEGLQYFEEMVIEYGLSPGIEHYTCMVDLLGRANQLSEAVDLVKRMSQEPDAILWISILNAAWKWNNLDVGRTAFDSLLRLDCNSAAAYVLMSNIYARAGRWEESAKLLHSDAVQTENLSNLPR